MSRTEDLRTRYAAAMMPTYGVPPVALSHGTGCTVYDVDGKPYLDMIAGLAVNALGYGNAAVTAAVTAQLDRIAHTSNLFVNEPQIALAERLGALVGGNAKTFLTNSGTEANEAALKLALAHGKPQGREYVVACEDGFHGRTMGSLALTGKPAIRDAFTPFGVDVRFVAYGDADALKAAVTDECAAVFCEPIQGESGVVPPAPGYLRAARDICDDTGALLVVDEIQSGIGRTGAWFAHQHAGITPDVITLAKGLGGGLPIGACLGVGKAGHVLTKGSHGSTFGGNPVAASAALAVLDEIENRDLLAHVVTTGHYLSVGVRALAHPLVAHVRGAGLWRAIVLTADVAADVDTALREFGVLANPVRPDVIRLAPPLTIGTADIDRFLSILPSALDAADPTGGST